MTPFTSTPNLTFYRIAQSITQRTIIFFLFFVCAINWSIVFIHSFHEDMIVFTFHVCTHFHKSFLESSVKVNLHYYKISECQIRGKNHLQCYWLHPTGEKISLVTGCDLSDGNLIVQNATKKFLKAIGLYIFALQII